MLCVVMCAVVCCCVYCYVSVANKERLQWEKKKRKWLAIRKGRFTPQKLDLNVVSLFRRQQALTMGQKKPTITTPSSNWKKLLPVNARFIVGMVPLLISFRPSRPFKLQSQRKHLIKSEKPKINSMAV